MSKVKIALIIVIIGIQIISIIRILDYQKQVKAKDAEIKNLKTQIHQLKNDTDEFKKQIENLKKEIETVKVSKAEVKTQQRASTAVTSTLDDSNVCVIAGKKYFPQSQWENMKLVIQRESGGNPNAVSKTNDHGCFQIHDWALYDPSENAKVAYNKYASRGWTPWYAVRGILW